MREPKMHSAKHGDLMTLDGCLHVLDLLRDDMRHQLTAADLDKAEEATDNEPIQSGTDGFWEAYRDNPQVLMGIAYGMSLSLEMAKHTADPVFQMIPWPVYHRGYMTLLMSVLKYLISLHNERDSKTARD